MPKVLKSNCKKLWRLSTCKKLTSSLTSFLRYWKDIASLLFWELWECLTITIKITVSVCSKLSCLSACKKINFVPHVFLEILQRYATYFGYFGYAWLHTPKLIVSTCRRLRCFFVNLGKNKFSREKELCQFLNTPIIYHRAKNQKSNEPFLRKMPNWQTDWHTTVIL